VAGTATFLLLGVGVMTVPISIF
jgi:drug/metabolite transporter (DMT)-like permease